MNKRLIQPSGPFRRRLCVLLAGIWLLLCFAPGMGFVQAAEISPQEDVQIGGKDSGMINLLLIGKDRTEGQTYSRADSIILCSFQKSSEKITMTSFLRDLYVDIPEHRSNRLNAAYAIGGSSLLKQTLEQNFGIYTDGCIEVDFSQFCQLVDLQGGVCIPLRQDEADWINANVPDSRLQEGTQTLNGSQALAYVRIRNLDPDGDFSRTRRQRTIITALFGSYQDVSLKEILSLLGNASDMISTDLKKTRLVSLAMELFPMLQSSTVVSQRIPADGTYTAETIDGMAVLVADPEAARAQLFQSLMEEKS